jgi:hypothetical protein
MNIYRVSEILIIHLKRFKCSGGIYKNKLNNVVKFPI